MTHFHLQPSPGKIRAILFVVKNCGEIEMENTETLPDLFVQFWYVPTEWYLPDRRLICL